MVDHWSELWALNLSIHVGSQPIRSNSLPLGPVYTESASRWLTIGVNCGVITSMPDGLDRLARRFPASFSPLAMLVAIATIALLGDASGQSTPATPELILRNGHIVTVDAAFSIAEAVAIAGGRFVGVG